MYYKCIWDQHLLYDIIHTKDSCWPIHRTIPSSTRPSKYQIDRDCQQALSSPSPEPIAFYRRSKIRGRNRRFITCTCNLYSH